jgi:uncharacterized membrane protein YeaQ/YmgE (transglycosylase-associated protein family)
MLIEILVLALIAGIVGSIAQSIVGFSRGGCLTSIAVGLIGALVGTYLSRAVGMGDILAVQIAGAKIPIVWSIIGAALFVAVISLIARRPTP